MISHVSNVVKTTLPRTVQKTEIARPNVPSVPRTILSTIRDAHHSSWFSSFGKITISKFVFVSPELKHPVTTSLVIYYSRSYSVKTIPCMGNFVFKSDLVNISNINNNNYINDPSQLSK